ncbi:lipase 1 precursor [Sporothrix schenckii 1099-18]|uniref:Lipase 1 n=1 Tax=Sporothrix schenckii 1099-18 TaxID=1397361 RepID=A0A0F2MJB9_SPOSC|nr:lipase 1 precursor [Sporothrix schenckii 1099-18]KJR88276.1 lipase 1 precursor [Sporothrix schenckii 1099-18]
MQLAQLITFCATYIVTVHADVGDGSVSGTRLPKPSRDPWMTTPPPAGWESAALGTVLKVRPHAYNMSKSAIGFEGYRDVFQLMFRSSDSHSQPMVGVTTVFVPDGRGGDGAGNASTSHVPVLSYHPPYDTACIDASPSYGLQFGEPYGEIALALKRGWFVSVPDYEGPQASYGAGVLAGHVLLDATKAVVATLRQGVPTSADLPTFRNTTATPATPATHNVTVAFWGYSSGAGATNFALEMADAYAPDLVLHGAVVGGMTANLTHSLELLSGRDVAGLLAQTLLGITTQYPDQKKVLDDSLWPSGIYNVSEFYSARNMSGWQSLVHFAYQNMFSYFRESRASIFGPASMREMLKTEGWAGQHGTPPWRTRTFYYQAVADEMCPAEQVDRLVDSICAARKNATASSSSSPSLFLYQRNLVGGHNDELSNGRQRALDFLGEILDGTQTAMTAGLPATGCVIQNVTVSVDPNGPFH